MRRHLGCALWTVGMLAFALTLLAAGGWVLITVGFWLYELSQPVAVLGILLLASIGVMWLGSLLEWWARNA